MGFKTARQVEEKLEEILGLVKGNKPLIDFLKGCDSSNERWKILETYIVNHLADYNLEHSDWGLETQEIGFLRERVFYEMQQRTKMDFGFCPYFIPAYEAITRYFLEGQGDPEKNWDKCNFDGEEMQTTCNGTSRKSCIHLRRSSNLS